MDTAKHTAFWRESALEDWNAARSLMDKGHLRHGLFFVHLAIEKTIKAAVVHRTGEMPPKSHDLLRLGTLADLQLDDGKRLALTRIGRYCLEGRYPDTWGGPPDETEAREVVAEAEEMSRWLETLFEKK
jgi:HEPN domain-containing protein